MSGHSFKVSDLFSDNRAVNRHLTRGGIYNPQPQDRGLNLIVPFPSNFFEKE